MKATKAKKDPVVPDQSGRLMPADPMGINATPDEVKRQFNVSAALEAKSAPFLHRTAPHPILLTFASEREHTLRVLREST